MKLRSKCANEEGRGGDQMRPKQPKPDRLNDRRQKSAWRAMIFQSQDMADGRCAPANREQKEGGNGRKSNTDSRVQEAKSTLMGRLTVEARAGARAKSAGPSNAT